MVAPLLGVNAGITVVASLVLIGALVVNILVLTEVNKGPPKPDGPPVTTTPVPGTKGCAASGKVSDNGGFANAATQLLRGVDRTVDPCDDFYSFTCNSFTNNKNETESTNDQPQDLINVALADYYDNLGDTDFKTEQIAKKAYQLCSNAYSVELANPNVVTKRTKEVDQDLQDYIGFPFFGKSKGLTRDTIWETIGTVERHFLTSILVGSGVSRDLGVDNAAALYIDQGPLPHALDYYVLPSFIANLQKYEKDLEKLLNAYRKTLNLTVADCAAPKKQEDCIKDKASWVIEFERKIAMASWPDTEGRNSEQQYNPMTFDDLPRQFPGINLQGYVNSLLADLDGVLPLTQQVIIDEPTYMAWLSSMLEAGTVTVDELTDYLAISFLLASKDYHFLGAAEREQERAQRKDKRMTGIDAIQPQAVRRGRGVRKLSYKPMLPFEALEAPDGVRNLCVELLLVFLPYAPGYTYVKELRKDDRDDVIADVTIQTNYVIEAMRNMIDSLEWMADADKQASKDKLDPANLIQNIGWPTWMYGDFDAAAEAQIDDYHVDYLPILDAKSFWEALKTMEYGMETREFFRMLLQTTNEELRRNFLQSPAMVNAWYQPELNSITFPMAAFVPPYYDLSFPQAYRYAGQGGTGGHELTHGLDDEGIQYGPKGLLVGCNYVTCGILGPSSRSGFTDMAQCVVQQYNMQCCPVKSGNVRCANGATTQGENIADIGGELAAYNAYKMWIANNNGGNQEDLLPGMEDFTANQVFWITYGFSWCAKTTDEDLVTQLMTDPHAPSVCRVNQVVQDIPQFGRDFKCKRGSTEYPLEADRCKVWTSLG